MEPSRQNTIIFANDHEWACKVMPQSILTVYYVICACTVQTNEVWMWLDREEEDRVVFLLFSYYTWKVREWFALSFALVIIPIFTHTWWIRTFSCASRERTVLNNIHVDSNWVPPMRTSVLTVFSWRWYHMREVRVYFARWFVFIH